MHQVYEVEAGESESDETSPLRPFNSAIIFTGLARSGLCER